MIDGKAKDEVEFLTFQLIPHLKSLEQPVILCKKLRN